MKQTLCILLVIITLGACQESPETTFTKDGVSITCPAGWKITDEEPIEGDQGYCISIEKDGLDASGLLSLSWINDSVDLNAYVEIYEEEMRNNIVYKASNINFETPSGSEFNRNPSLAVKYNLSLVSVAHVGIVHIFYQGGKTFSVLRQEAVEDLAKNKAGFEFLEQTFAVE